MKQVSHGKDGEIHGENQTTDDEPKQHHQQRFNQGKQAANRPALARAGAKKALVSGRRPNRL
jgi:hypothetical protein